MGMKRGTFFRVLWAADSIPRSVLPAISTTKFSDFGRLLRGGGVEHGGFAYRSAYLLTLCLALSSASRTGE